MKLRDNQRSRVYKLDGRLKKLIGDRYLGKRDQRAVLKSLNGMTGGSCKLTFRCGGRYSFYRPSTQTVHMLPCAHSEDLLHEFAHYLVDGRDIATGQAYASHGPTFVGQLLSLVVVLYGFDLARLLRIAEEEGVRYK